MVEITLPVILQIVQTTGILVGIVYYLSIMRNMQKTREQTLKNQEEAEKARQRDLILQRIHGFDIPFARAWGDVMFKDPERWNEVYDPNKNLDTWANMVYLQNRYQNVGVLLKEGYIEGDLLFQIFNPGSIIAAWEHFKANILSRSKSRSQPDLFSGFEYLAMIARKKYPDVVPSRPQ